MACQKKLAGDARIFKKALQSVFDSTSSQKDPVIYKERRLSKESKTECATNWPSKDMPISPEIMAPSILNLKQVESNDNKHSFQTDNFQLIPSDIPSWVENNLLAAINETDKMIVNNETDQWIKKNRLKALNNLRNGQFSSPCTTVSNEEMSPTASNTHVTSETPANLPLSRKFSVKSVSVSGTKNESDKSDRPASHQGEIKPEFDQKSLFLTNKKYCQMNFGLQSNVKSSCKSAEMSQFVFKSSHRSLNQELYEVKESGPKNIQVKNSEFQTETRNCCEPRTENKDNAARLPSYNVSSLKNLKSVTGFMDAHCHIDFLFNDEKFNGTYPDYIAEHKDSYPDSYKGCIAVFCRPWTFSKVNIWRKHIEQNNVWGAFGCHPKQAKFYDTDVERHLEYALDHPKVRALGEIGLDYSKENERSKDVQHFIFRRQLKIAQRRNLRVVIHCRDADDDAIKIMHEILPKDAIFHLHCFTGCWEKAERWIEEFPNVYIGITNLVTFPSAVETHEVARRLPLKRLLLETDSPFFVPKKAPRGTKHSHPGMAIHVAAQIAALKSIHVDEVLQATYTNTRFVYNIS